MTLKYVSHKGTKPHISLLLIPVLCKLFEYHAAVADLEMPPLFAEDDSSVDEALQTIKASFG